MNVNSKPISRFVSGVKSKIKGAMSSKPVVYQAPAPSRQSQLSDEQLRKLRSRKKPTHNYKVPKTPSSGIGVGP